MGDGLCLTCGGPIQQGQGACPLCKVPVRDTSVDAPKLRRPTLECIETELEQRQRELPVLPPKQPVVVGHTVAGIAPSPSSPTQISAGPMGQPGQKAAGRQDARSREGFQPPRMAETPGSGNVLAAPDTDEATEIVENPEAAVAMIHQAEQAAKVASEQGQAPERLPDGVEVSFPRPSGLKTLPRGLFDPPVTPGGLHAQADTAHYDEDALSGEVTLQGEPLPPGVVPGAPGMPAPARPAATPGRGSLPRVPSDNFATHMPTVLDRRLGVLTKADKAAPAKPDPLRKVAIGLALVTVVAACVLLVLSILG